MGAREAVERVEAAEVPHAKIELSCMAGDWEEHGGDILEVSIILCCPLCKLLEDFSALDDLFNESCDLDGVCFTKYFLLSEL